MTEAVGSSNKHIKGLLLVGAMAFVVNLILSVPWTQAAFVGILTIIVLIVGLFLFGILCIVARAEVVVGWSSISDAVETFRKRPLMMAAANAMVCLTAGNLGGIGSIRAVAFAVIFSLADAMYYKFISRKADKF